MEEFLKRNGIHKFYRFIEKLEKELLKIKYVTKIDFDLLPYLDNIKAPIILVNYEIDEDIDPQEYFKNKSLLKKEVIKTIEKNGVKVEKEEFEDNDTYFYIVSYHTNWEE